MLKSPEAAAAVLEVWRCHLICLEFLKIRPRTKAGIIKFSYFVGDQTVQIYGKFEGFSLDSAVLGLAIKMTPV